MTGDYTEARSSSVMGASRRAAASCIGLAAATRQAGGDAASSPFSERSGDRRGPHERRPREHHRVALGEQQRCEPPPERQLRYAGPFVNIQLGYDNAPFLVTTRSVSTPTQVTITGRFTNTGTGATLATVTKTITVTR
jgi:hypothetical protein